MFLRRALILSLAAACCGPWIWAESTDCTTPVIVMADGRVTQSAFPQATTYWFGVYAQSGHSYSVEFLPPADNNLNTIRIRFSALGVFGPNDAMQSCRGTSSVAVTQNSGYGPVILKNGNGAGRRVSFTAQTAGLYLLSATNVGGAGNYSFRAVDTTMVNGSWSTCGGFDNQWIFENVSDMAVTGALTVYDFGNNPLLAVQFVIPPGGGAIRYSHPFDLNLPRNSTGYAIFTHNGPPNSIMANAYLLNGGATVIVLARFESVVTR